MSYKIKVKDKNQDTLYTAEEYREEDCFIEFKDKFNKKICVNKEDVRYIREV